MLGHAISMHHISLNGIELILQSNVLGFSAVPQSAHGLTCCCEPIIFFVQEQRHSDGYGLRMELWGHDNDVQEASTLCASARTVFHASQRALLHQFPKCCKTLRSVLACTDTIVHNNAAHYFSQESLMLLNREWAISNSSVLLSFNSFLH